MTMTTTSSAFSACAATVTLFFAPSLSRAAAIYKPAAILDGVRKDRVEDTCFIMDRDSRVSNKVKIYNIHKQINYILQ